MKEEIALSTVAIVCRTIEDEINAVLKTLPGPFPIVWIESRLHSFPLKLKDTIQQEIDKLSGVENILLLSGYCGNAIEGLVARQAQLVVPKVGDCISLLLGGDQTRHDLSGNTQAYYFTEGWLRYENNICWEYERCLEKYGKATTLYIFRTMLAHYSAFDFINTGTYELGPAMTKTAALAVDLDLMQAIVPGNLGLVTKALKGEWDEDFLLVAPGIPVHLGYCPVQQPRTA
jgi:hypothetical protein